ncbi:hypothetical protein [Paenibacillus sp. OV219]|uniref:hypothetical protein n=1 Tax=Paenibacillus sp. OV219 TaxID=1884377 RepID=UPI0008CD705D|nr:hypothetical protein [Paenibacillus sp. OV219]SEO02315.1 hypothetical protein SAMN05518847_105279 [Paenibacillus sp. OV219]
MNLFRWRFIRTLGLFALGIGMYLWTFTLGDLIFVKIILAEAGSVMLFCSIWLILNSFNDTSTIVVINDELEM